MKPKFDRKKCVMRGCRRRRADGSGQRCAPCQKLMEAAQRYAAQHPSGPLPPGNYELEMRRQGRTVLGRVKSKKRPPAPLPTEVVVHDFGAEPPDPRGRTREEMSDALAEGAAAEVDPATAIDMISRIRRITDEANLSGVPFLDDAVQELVDDAARLRQERNALRDGCREHQRCIQCVGPLDVDSISRGHERCGRCFKKDYAQFIRRHSARLTQLPEPRPEVSSM